MNFYQEYLILKFLNETISADELGELDLWINKSEENHKIFKDFKDVWALYKKDELPNFETQSEWERLESVLNKSKTADTKELDTTKWQWLKIAASVSLLVICSFVLYLLLKDEKVTHTATNSTLYFKLPDGSEVWLNHDSELTYTADDFNAEDRSVHLKGEGFFSVRKNPDKPFIIEAEQSMVKVLGTSFNVDAYKKNQIKVLVVTGLVSFSSNKNKDKHIIIKPGESAILIERNTIVKEVNTDPNALAWKEERLIFRKTSLNKVLMTLHDYFKVDINVVDENLLNCRFTSTFTNPNLDEILEALSVSLDIKVIREKNSYTLKGGSCR